MGSKPIRLSTDTETALIRRVTIRSDIGSIARIGIDDGSGVYARRSVHILHGFMPDWDWHRSMWRSYGPLEAKRSRPGGRHLAHQRRQ